MQQTLFDYIDSSPDKCGGRPCIAGTRIRVQDVYVWHELERLSPDDIVFQFPELTLAKVFAALTYLHAHRQEIEEAFVSEQRFSDELKAKHPSRLLNKTARPDADPSSILS